MHIFFFSLLLIMTLGIGIFLVPEQKKEEPIQKQKKEVAIPAPRVSYQTDTDGDGMPDWEEKLRGTDPKIPDRPKPVQPEIIARLEEKRIETIVPVVPVIPFSPITISSPTQPVAEHETTRISSIETIALHAFGNSLGEALAPIANESFEQETTTRLNAAITSEGERGGLAPIAAAYTAVSAALKEVAAPPQGGGAAILTKLSASYESLAGALASLARASGDPQETGNAWLAYSDAALGVGKALNETLGFFATSGIVFSPTEPGAFFNTN